MAEMVICGICLNTNVKMYRLQGYQLEDDYTWIVGNLLEANISHYYRYACYECAHHIKKYNSFREKCLQSQSLLNEMLQMKGQLTINDIKSIDRQAFSLCSKLVYGLPKNYTVGYADIKQDYSIELETDILKEVNNVKIELELHEEKENEIKYESDDEEPFSTVKIENKETPKTQQIKKTVVESVNNCQKKESLKESLEKDSSRETGRKSKMQRRKRVPKQNSERPTPLDNSLAENFKIITFTLEEQLEQLQKRKESSNYINSIHKCNICYKGFRDPDAFNKHMRRHDPANGAKICPICKMCYKMSSELRSHRMRHTKNYICKMCSTVCFGVTQAKSHIKGHEGKTYKCEKCDCVYRKLSSLLSHIRIKHPSNFVCGICGFSFVSELGLKHHKSRHRFDAESDKSRVSQMGYCEACDFHNNSHQAWKFHINSLGHKIKVNGLNCLECNEKFQDKEDFRMHLLSFHSTELCSQKKSKRQSTKVQSIKVQSAKGQSTKRIRGKNGSDANHKRETRNESVPKVWPSKCSHCDQIIRTQRKYYFHLRTSHPDKPYPITKNVICDVCGKRFLNNGCLKYHKRVHDPRWTFKCTECSKSFSTGTILRIHKKSHSDVRPYSCHVCGKSFKTNGNLQKHAMIHTGEKPYSCKHCGKAFNQASSVKIHILTVHLKQPAPYVSRKRRRVPSKESE